METIIFRPKNEEEKIFFLELAKRLGVKTQSIEEFEDEQLLQAMRKSKLTDRVSKEKVINTLNNILNEGKVPYKN